MSAEQVDLAPYENGNDGTAKEGSFHGPEKTFEDLVDAIEGSVGSFIRTSIFGRVFPLEVYLPIDFEDFIPHEDKGQDGWDTASRAEQGGRAKTKHGRCRHHVDVVVGAASHWREGAIVSIADQATHPFLAIGEMIRVENRISVDVRPTFDRIDAIELNCQAKEPFVHRSGQQPRNRYG